MPFVQQKYWVATKSVPKLSDAIAHQGAWGADVCDHVRPPNIYDNYIINKVLRNHEPSVEVYMYPVPPLKLYWTAAKYVPVLSDVMECQLACGADVCDHELPPD